jgi:hypothetical protein
MNWWHIPGMRGVEGSDPRTKELAKRIGGGAFLRNREEQDSNRYDKTARKRQNIYSRALKSSVPRIC